MVKLLLHLHRKNMKLNEFKFRKCRRPADRHKQVRVTAKRELITRMEAKIQATLGRVWGEATNAPEPN